MDYFSQLPVARDFELSPVNHPENKTHKADDQKVLDGKAEAGDIVQVTGYHLDGECFYSGDTISLKKDGKTLRWLQQTDGQQDLDENQYKAFCILKAKEQGLPKVVAAARALKKAMKGVALNSQMLVLEEDNIKAINFVLAEVGEGKDAMTHTKRSMKDPLPSF